MARAAVCYAFRFFGRIIPDRSQLVQSPLYRLLVWYQVQQWGTLLKSPSERASVAALVSESLYLRLRAI